MEQIPLAAERRESTGKGPARQMRVEGQVPAIFYSGGQEADKLTIEKAEIDRVLRVSSGGTAFLSLIIGDDAPRMAVIKELQFDYLGKSVLHADFYEVRADQELTIDVPIELVGEPKGMTTGTLLSQTAYTAAIVGTVADIPDSLTLDVTEMEIGDALYSDALTLPEGAKLQAEENFMIVSLSEATLALEEEEEEEGEEGEGEEGAEGEGAGEEEKTEEGSE
ncbi:MAG: 50S ribosomal protein L25 [Desulfarculaceae bacterium]|nr:50S ribosomal protein L25 [Desulfarculaceae bacterium]